MGVWSGDTEIFVRDCMCSRVRMRIGFSQGWFTGELEIPENEAFFHCLECGHMEWVNEELEELEQKELEKEKRRKEDD